MTIGIQPRTKGARAHLSSRLSWRAGLRLWLVALPTRLRWTAFPVCPAGLGGGAECDGQVELRTVNQRAGGEQG